MLPTFRQDARKAIEMAVQAEEAGLDGVFAFDHLWPLGSPERPALSCRLVLAAVAARTERIVTGTLVSRVGLLPDEILLAELRGVQEVSGGRLVAGLGVGDRKSVDEHLRTGIPMAPAGERRAAMSAVGRALTAGGATVWIGGGSPATTAVGVDLGVPVNLWEAPEPAVAAVFAAGAREVTWGGPLPDDPVAAGGRVASLAAAGVSWVVVAIPRTVGRVVEIRAAAGL